MDLVKRHGDQGSVLDGAPKAPLFYSSGGPASRAGRTSPRPLDAGGAKTGRTRTSWWHPGPPGWGRASKRQRQPSRVHARISVAEARGVGGPKRGEGRRRAHAATVPAVPTWPRATARSRASPRPRGGQNAQVESRPLRGPAQASGRGGACGASRARAQCPRRRSRGRVREALGGCARFLGSTSPPAQFFAALGPPLPPPLPPCHPPSARCEGRAGARRTSTRAYAGACAGGRTRDVSHAAARDHAHSLKLAPPPALRACPGSLRARRKLAHLHAARPGDEIVAIRQRAGRGPGGGRAPSEPRVRASPGARTPPSQASAAMQSARSSTAQIERLATNLPLSNSPRASLSLGKPQRPRT